MTPTRSRRTARLIAGAVAVGVLGLTGCGIEDRIVHLQPAPTENVAEGAPLRLEMAERIAERVLTDVGAAESSEERQEILVGSALRIAGARMKLAEDTEAETSEVSEPSAPAILAMTSGQEWPRAMLASALDGPSQVRHLYVLVSTGPTDQYKVHAMAPMLGGTAVPYLGEFAEGASFEAATAEEAIDASQVMLDYAAGITFPRPASVDSVAVNDPYAEALNRNARAQADALDDLGAVAQTHVPISDTVLSFTTPDGARVIFAQMVRTDRIALSDAAKELQIEDEVLQEISGKEVVTTAFTAEFLENVVLVAPPGAPAELIGAEEIVLRASGE
ncbi:MAG: hypothetical protein Q4G67_01435 [Actinomycetia bacterium]|nr:hypothetical protein [Actinomycetes bacterium]